MGGIDLCMGNKSLFLIVILVPCMLCTCQKEKVLKLGSWEYVCIDSTRTKNDVDSNMSWFGMDFRDANCDGLADIVAGKWLYINMDKNGKSWKKNIVKDSIDNMFITNIDGDQYTDIIGLKCNWQLWLEANDSQHSQWTTRVIGNEKICSHNISSMGFCRADIFEGGKYEFLFTEKPGMIYCFCVPENSSDNWDVITIADKLGTEKFVSPGDIDGDGDLDLATGYQVGRENHPRGICWFENPGVKKGYWNRHTIGQIDHMADHFSIADFNNDGLPEILVTEGRAKGTFPAGIYLFIPPNGDVLSGQWDKIQISEQYSTNSLELADLDKDGDIDFVTGEHKGTCKLQIWENMGHFNFIEHVIDSSKESHNGTKLFDLEGDGDLDIATVGWSEYQYVHLWINKAIN